MFPLRDDNSLPSETTKLQKSHPTLETQTQRTEDINKRKSSVIWPRQDASNCATFSLPPPLPCYFCLALFFEKGESNINRRRYFSPDSFGIDPIYMLPRAFADIGRVTQTRHILSVTPRPAPAPPYTPGQFALAGAEAFLECTINICQGHCWIH